VRPLTTERFEAFTPQHYLLLALFAVGAVAIVVLGRRQRGTEAAVRFSRVLAVAIPCFTVPSQVWQLTGDFDVDTSLPLQLCDFTWIVAVWGLWTHRRLPASLTYFWGLTLTTQAILTPSLGQAFPDPRYLTFWGMHFLIVWSALYLSLGLGIGPTWRTYRATVTLTVLWAVVVYAIDVTADLNYGYLVRKPASASLLDALGPWPVYVVAALVLLLVAWALMTWPWVAVRRRTPREADSPH
jgi:hypothetical integral membrane protein (TIGR02206 family)